MANFLEFLKSGKTAREFIDDAILPQHVRAVVRVGTSPKSHTEEDLATSTESEIPTPELDDLSGVDDKAHDIMDTSVLSESEESPDDDFLRQLEAFEKTAGVE